MGFNSSRAQKPFGHFDQVERSVQMSCKRKTMGSSKNISPRYNSRQGVHLKDKGPMLNLDSAELAKEGRGALKND